MVAPGGAAFDLHENVRGRNRLGDAHHLANLVTVPGLKHTYGNPRRELLHQSHRSSGSGMPAEMTTPSIGAPEARFFGTMREVPNCRFHR